MNWGLEVWGPRLLGLWKGLRSLTHGLREKDTGGQDSRVQGKKGAESWTPRSEGNQGWVPRLPGS